jgi:predicted GTPase
MIAGLNSNNKRIQTLKHSYAKAIKSAQEKQSSDQMNDILQENASYQNSITEKLKAIAEEVKSSE